MARLFLIRHGEPAGAWGAAEDPGLSELGRLQAAQAAARLPVGLLAVTSPMLRCRETAAPYEARLGAPARVEARVSEVATPPGLADRRAWLAQCFPFAEGAPGRDWASLEPALHAWRAEVLAALAEIEADAAIFSHFIAINVIVGAAMGRGDTIVCRPGHASITIVRAERGALHLEALGEDATGSDVRWAPRSSAWRKCARSIQRPRARARPRAH